MWLLSYGERTILSLGTFGLNRKIVPGLASLQEALNVFGTSVSILYIVSPVMQSDRHTKFAHV